MELERESFRERERVSFRGESARRENKDKIFVLCLKRLNCDQLSLKSVCGVLVING